MCFLQIVYWQILQPILGSDCHGRYSQFYCSWQDIFVCTLPIYSYWIAHDYSVFCDKYQLLYSRLIRTVASWGHKVACCILAVLFSHPWPLHMNAVDLPFTLCTEAPCTPPPPIPYSVWVWLSALPIPLGFCFLAVLLSCLVGNRELPPSSWACSPGVMRPVCFFPCSDWLCCLPSCL